jgi:hypothetical protein
MKRQNHLLILWIIFGFIYISAIETVLHYLNFGIFYASVALNMPYSVLEYALPSFPILSYGLTTYFILKHIKTKSGYDGIYLTNFPKRTFVIAAIAFLALPPIFNRLSALVSVNGYDYYTNIEWLNLYAYTSSAIGISQWFVLIILTIVFLRKLNN